MPAFSYKRILVIFGAFKRPIGYFVTPSVKRAFAYRVKQERAKDAKWRVEI